MKRTVIGAVVAVAVALAVTLGFFWARAPRATRIPAGGRLPSVELPFAVADSRSRLDAIHGDPLLLVFLETTSPGGRAFANAIERVHRRYMRRGLNLVAVALDEDRDQLRKVLAEDPITYMVLHDPGGRVTSPSMGMPQPGDAYLLSADGELDTAFVTGDDWNDLRIQFAIERLLPKGR